MDGWKFTFRSVSRRFLPSTVVLETYRGEQVDLVVQDHQFGTGLLSVDRAVQEGSSALNLHLSSHMVHLLTNLKEVYR